MTIFGVLLIIGALVWRDELLHALQKREFERLRGAWDHAHGPLPAPVPSLPTAKPSPRRARLRNGALCHPAQR